MLGLSFWEIIKLIWPLFALIFVAFLFRILLEIFPLLLNNSLRSIFKSFRIIKRPLYRKYSNNSKTYIDENGYRRFSDSDKLVHRWVAGKKLGGLYEGEVVHHRNRNKLDNRPGNLEVFENQYEHDAAHGYDNYGYNEEEDEEDY